MQSKIAVLVGALIGVNAALWLAVLLQVHSFPFLLTTGLLAFGFGLRHAVDADHIAAIDNTTRKLMQEGKRPTGVGLFFSLGHSTIVIALCAALAMSTAYIQAHMPALRSVGGLVGSVVSGAFLYIVGIINLTVLFDLVKAMRAATLGTAAGDEQVEALLQQRGLLGRIFRPVMRLVRRSRDMYLVGVLFGLGFDTATEVGILAVSARSAQMNIPFWTVMLLPLLFTAGMCLIDTIDGILMLGCYGWSFANPARKLVYNFAITLLSAVLALSIGSVELLQTAAQVLKTSGPFWAFVDRLNLANLGYWIVGGFVGIWLLAAAYGRAAESSARRSLTAE